MKIACLLGVSDYKNCTPLPGCINDLELMEKLLHATGEYTEVCRIDGNQPSVQVKQELVEFFTRHR